MCCFTLVSLYYAYQLVVLPSTAYIIRENRFNHLLFSLFFPALQLISSYQILPYSCTSYHIFGMKISALLCGGIAFDSTTLCMRCRAI